MNEKLTGKAFFAAALAAIGSALGWRGCMALAWVAAMLLDYLSGSAAACKAGSWSSAQARQGLWHKGGMILVVAVAALADAVLTVSFGVLQIGFAWPGCVFPLVLAWYILTELGSILENAMSLGAPVPKWLLRMLQCSLEAVDRAAEQKEG